MLHLLAAATFAAASRPYRVAGSPRSAIRASRSSPGTAGILWEGLIGRLPEARDALDITWVDGDPGQMQTFILSGALDVGPYGPTGIAEAAQRGIDLVTFGPMLNNHGSWLVRGDSPYRSPHDLKGRRIATLAPTSDTYRQARMAAALNGLDLRKDFEIVHGPPTSNVALFGRGDVDGLIMLEPTSTRLIARGAREIARVSDMWRTGTGDAAPLMLVGISGLRSWVEANRAKARLFAGMLAAVNRTISERPEILTEPETLELLKIPASEAAAVALLPKRLATIYASDWGDGVFANIDRQLDVALQLELIQRKPERPIHDRLDT